MIKVRGKTDALLILIVVVLSTFGVVMVFSASYYSTLAADIGPYFYLQRALQWTLGGFGVMAFVSIIPHRVYYKMAPILVGLSLILLAVLFTPLGYEANNATRWIQIGEVTFMPGEFAKFAAIVGVAWYYSKYADQTKTVLRGFLGVFVLAGVYFLLIYKQPNLSTALIVALTIVAMMFIAGVNFGLIAAGLAAGAALAYRMIQTAGGFHQSRMTIFLDPFADAQGEGYQTVQGLLALGSGGLTGVGLGNSVQKALWLPYAQNDFIFAIIGEETGFIGCLLVIIAFVILIWRCMLIAMRSRDRFAMLLGSGVAILFALQVVMNIGVVTNVLPPTGVILPFISYGGNAIIVFMLLIGIMLNIARSDGPETAAQERKRTKRESRRQKREEAS